VYYPVPSPPTYISWGKRQNEAEPTDAPDVPEDPEDPQGPIEIPPAPVPNLPNSIGLEPPTATVIWGKRQEESDPEDPQDPIEITPTPVPNPPNSVGLDPPTETVIWGKRQDDTHTIGAPTVTVIWGKRQEETDPTDDPVDPEEPEDPVPDPPNTIGIEPPTVTVIWGRDYPVSPPHVPQPTLSPPKPSTPPGCAIPTATLIPVCEPPKCPARSTPCDLNRRVPRMEKLVRREIEKRVVMIETVGPPVTKCTASRTKTVVKTCPTYTCVPGCEAARVVR
jgi:hypothetical protein